MKTKPRILFYVERSLHLPFLEPIHDYLSDNQLADTAFSAPEYFQGTNDIPGWGLSEKRINDLPEKSLFFQSPEEFEPDVTVVADACHFRIPQIKNIINVGHGMICKGCFYTDSLIVRRENLSEMLLVPGPWHKRRLKDNVSIPIKVTGFIKSDQLFGAKALSREQFCAQRQIDPKKKIILFAPTYNPELSAIHCLGEKISELASQDRVLLIKTHNLTDKYWKNFYFKLAFKHTNIHYLSDQDYSGMMHAADLMISDVSSIFLEFILLDKPVVLYNNPAKETFVHYRADEIEYQTRNAAKLVSTIQELLKALDSELENPNRLSSIRRQYAKALDYGRDGKSTQRAAKAILDWYQNNIAMNSPEIANIILQAPNKNQLIADIKETENKSGRFNSNLFVIGQNVKIKEFAAKQQVTVLDKVESLLDHTAFEHYIFLQSGYYLPYNFIKYLYNHFFWNKNVGVVKAVSQKEIGDHILQRLTNDPHIISDPEILSFGLLTMAIGQSVPAENISSACIMCTRKVLVTLLQDKALLDQNTILKDLTSRAAELNQDVLLAADCFVWNR